MSRRPVQVRDVFGQWHDAVALSEARCDYEKACHRGQATFLSVSVRVPGWEHPINWPAKDVRDLTVPVHRSDQPVKET